MLTHELANEIVTRTMDIVPSNVNIMNAEGAVIASGEKKRLFNIHSIAVDVLRTGKSISINPTGDCPSGTKPGINLPIRFQGKSVGVIGITGNPVEVAPYAELVQMAAELLVNQAYLSEQLRQNERIAYQLLRALVVGEVENERTFMERLQATGLDSLFLPLRAWALSKAHEQTFPKELGHFFQYEERGELFFFETRPEEKRFESFLQKNNCLLIATSGPVAHSFGTVASSCNIARAALSLYEEDVPTTEKRLLYFEETMLEGLAFEWQQSGTIQPFLALLSPLLASNQSAELIETIKQYFIHNGDIKKIANHQFVHSNTVHHRLNKIKALTGKNPKVIRELTDLFIACLLYQLNGIQAQGKLL
ncbi:sugar diacid recognition domain-containing protein [Shouchella clausii]|uniref:Sugar diacid recognition domain-containing protein n=1 Tax=Shouchella rhizosphaerae TaxID=866786 RepID=A0ABZ2CNF2_9BACI|nr:MULTISPECIES: sugar diacid recognition domain-containing protein [Shouchella]MCM3314124.1 helix-turn-helix domain-containing protein [Psychrobacillus sp. MER TA 17]ALA52087.1 Sugar diacid utilization regulator SdaR [Shouchella clausii]MBU3230464.1 helix-turn-helix domain-containing protein [Shouchella clausii]MBU3262337.1 helix-turn-helix domain-containing protein [Shouchella clausii]MBU3507348.1 helix-turn-helix domain-containing protein [Shouchella clausii]